MPDATTVSIFVEKYGWPGLTVVVLMLVLWRVMVKHEGQMTKVTESQAQQAVVETAHIEVNRQIAAHLEGLGSRLREHTDDDVRQHQETRRVISDERHRE